MSEDGGEVTAAVIGCNIGRLHAEGFRRSEGVRLVGVCDVVPAVADEAARMFSVPAYYSVDDLLETERPDLVSVATHEAHHVAPVLAALESGAHVLCEKIMADSVENGRIIKDAVARAVGRFGVSYNYRQIPRMQLVRELVRSGRLGQLSMVSVEATSVCWHHALDLIRWTLGPIRSVVAARGTSVRPVVEVPRVSRDFFYWPDPAAAAVLLTESGVLVSIASTMYVSLADQKIRFIYYGTDHRIEVVDMTDADSNGRVAGTRFLETADASIADLVTNAATESPFPLEETFYRSVGAFSSAVVAGRETPTTIDDGWGMVLLEAAIKRAADEGRSVDLAEVA